MVKNYLLTAWRHLAGNRLFSAINIFGLSLGLTSFILIVMYVQDELSYDQWLAGGDEVVRIHTAYHQADRPPFLTVRSAGRIMETLREFAREQVAEGVRIVQFGQTVIHNDRSFSETISFADPTFFDVLALPFRRGSAESSFTRPMDMVVTEAMAIKYFGTTDVIGKNLTVCCNQGQQVDVTITGVLQDIPRNSHLALDFLVLMDPSLFDSSPNILNTWTSVNTYTYFRLREGATPASFRERIDYWLDNESPMLQMVSDGEVPTDAMTINPMRVTDLHLHARREAGSMGDFKPLGDIRMVYAFSAVAALILAIAAINFMNLSTARASRRAREVALRKVLGASRGQVARQFLGEAVALTLVSLLFALVAVEIVLPLYNEATSRQFTLAVIEQPAWLAALLGMAIFLGLVSGSYPAVVLSRFRPARIMKANQSSEVSGQGRIRPLLVVFQFSVSIGLAVCTMVIYAQTQFARNLDVGYDYEQKLIMSGIGSSAIRDQQDALLRELRGVPGVSSVAFSSEAPSQDNENNTGFRLLEGAGDSGVQESEILNYYTAGYGFFETYGISLVAGRAFDPGFGTDEITPVSEGGDEIGQASVVINESAAAKLGFSNPADAVGKTLRADVFRAGRHDLTIVGVARDVYFRSIKFDIRPSVFFNFPANNRVATIAFTGDAEVIRARIERTWNAFAPTTPFEVRLLEDMMFEQYMDERKQASLFGAFAMLAVVIACLGLFGLASFTAERRTREIGIRKVMGARIRDIVKLLVWQFSTPVLIANAVAWPLAWYLMNNWLQSFTYRIDAVYILLASLLAGVCALLIAWLTVAARAFKVASASPVIALRYE